MLIANPNDAEAPVTLTFFKENGEQIVASRTLAAKSRATVHVDQIPGLEATAASVRVTSEDGLPLLVERTMFWDATSYAGHTGSAIDEPKPDWFFAEGAQGFFDTFVLVVNPTATAADVTFTFLRESGDPFTKVFTVPAKSRFNVDTGPGTLVPELVNENFGALITSTQPIAVERAMYSNANGQVWAAGTNATATALP